MKTFVIFLVFVSVVLVSGVDALTWTVNVDGRADFSSIHSAVMDDRVESGHTILVYPGIYREYVVVPAYKNLTIRSIAGFRETIIQAPEDKYKMPVKATVTIKSDSVFDGFTVEKTPGLMDAPMTYECISTRSKIIENTTAIFVTGPATIINNYVSGHRLGISVSCPAGALGRVPIVRYNVSEQNQVGMICCETYSEVRDNIIKNNSWIGVVIANASTDDVVNNLIVGNGSPERDFSAGMLIAQNYSLKDYALTARVAVNTITSNYGDGIIIRHEYGAPVQPVIEHCVIAFNSGVGIFVHPADDDNNKPRPRVFRCNIWNNLAGDTKNVDRLIDCMSEDPMFVDGFRLDYNSPCINRGSIADNLGSTSPDGRPDRGRLNLGFHYPVSIASPPGDLD